MKSNYARKLNRANIIFGIHVSFKIVIILILFVVLYTSIWIKEKYLTYVKASVYVQIFVFLTLSIVILVVNNPHSMDICSTFIYYFYLIISILELGIIAIEIYSMIKNLNQFIIRFHECPYCRTYQDITDLEYKRTCLYYNKEYNNELPYKYICYYNSEIEYYNSFCDGLICKKNNNKNEINSLVKCFKNIEKTEIQFPPDNEYYLKEFELIYKYKSSNLYSCFRKDKIEENNNIFNDNCPDSNPVKKMLIFIYSNLIIHLLIDFLFIYEFVLIQKIKQIYSNLVLLKNANENNILSNEDEANIQNLFNNSNTFNKKTINTENNNPSLYPSCQMKRDNSQSIIIIPAYKNSELDEIKSNYTEQDNNVTCVNKTIGNIIVHNSQNEDDNKNNKIIENEMYKRDSGQAMITVEINKEEEYGINRISFFIRKKKRKKSNHKKNNDINNNIIIEDKKIDIYNNININSNFNKSSRNKNNNFSKSASKDFNSICHLVEEQNNKKNMDYNDNKILDLTKNKSYLNENNNKLINLKLFKNNFGGDDIKNNNNNKNVTKKNKNKYKINQKNEKEEHKNNLDNFDNSRKYKENLNEKSKFSKDNNYINGKENKDNNLDNNIKNKNNGKTDYRAHNLIKINRIDK